jgi:hypothetical protein
LTDVDHRLGLQHGGRKQISAGPSILARLRSFALNILRAHGVTNVSEAVYTNALSLHCLLAYGLPKAQN